MTSGDRAAPIPLPGPGFPVATALRGAWRDGFSAHRLRTDIMAGLVVGIVALPLSMALAIASGVAPQHGLYTAIIAGAVAALAGGSRVSVTGPTAAFVVLLVPVSSQFGLGGLLLASLFAGLILVLMGVFRLGRFIQFVPHPVTTGFTAGIAVVIATLQIKDFLGLTIDGDMPEHYVERIQALARAMPTLNPLDAGFGIGTLALLITWGKLIKKVPAPLMGLTLAGLAAWVAHTAFGVDLDTIGSRFGGIPGAPPTLSLDRFLAGPDGERLVLSFDLVQQLLPAAFAIAMLGAIESLLCAVVADGMAGTKHDPDAELVGQGLGNLVAPFFGGFAATGALARTAASVRSGGRTPVASVTHAVFVLAAMVLLAPLLAWLPMASLAALLLVVAWNMSDARHFVRMLQIAPRSDILVLLACFGLTVIFDMVIAVGVGVVLAALLFMQRMADITQTRLLDGSHPHLIAELPPGTVLYEIAGPLFFGAAEKAAGTLHTVTGHVDTVILEMAGVPVMDATGLVALRSAIAKFHKAGTLVVLADVQPQPMTVLQKAGLRNEPGKLAICQTLAEAEMLVRLLDHRAEPPDRSPSGSGGAEPGDDGR